MQFEERVDGDSEGRMFRVKSTDPRGPSLTYVCQAEDAQTRARSQHFENFIHHMHYFAQVDGYDGKATADTEGVPASAASTDCLPQQTVERAVSREEMTNSINPVEESRSVGQSAPRLPLSGLEAFYNPRGGGTLLTLPANGGGSPYYDLTFLRMTSGVRTGQKTNA